MRYRWFINNVVKALEEAGVKYFLHKFRKPLEHMSVNLGILMKTEDVPRAVEALCRKGFGSCLGALHGNSC